MKTQRATIFKDEFVHVHRYLVLNDLRPITMRPTRGAPHGIRAFFLFMYLSVRIVQTREHVRVLRVRNNAHTTEMFHETSLKRSDDSQKKKTSNFYDLSFVVTVARVSQTLYAFPQAVRAIELCEREKIIDVRRFTVHLRPEPSLCSILFRRERTTQMSVILLRAL